VITNLATGHGQDSDNVSQAAGYNVLVIQISNGTVNPHWKLF